MGFKSVYIVNYAVKNNGTLPFRLFFGCKGKAIYFINWKTQARMTPAAKVDLTPENNLFLTPEEFGRRGQFYFGLSAFEGFELTDAFAGERDTVCGVDDAVEDGIRHCGVADGVVPVQFGEL